VSLRLAYEQTCKAMGMIYCRTQVNSLIKRILARNNQAQKIIDNIRAQQDILYRDIGASNSLDLTVRYGSDNKSILMKNFMDDRKIDQFKEEVSSLFALTINQLSKQTEDLLDTRQEVNRVVNKIKLMLRDLEGISVIGSIDLRTQYSHNRILQKLEQLQTLGEEYDFTGRNNLFNYDKPQLDRHNRAIQLIQELRSELDRSGKSELRLDDTYKLEIGVLLKELIAFANAKCIRFLNGAPNQQLVSRFKRIYLLTNKRNKTVICPLLIKC